MNSQELRAFQEAYLEVIENQQLDEGKVEWDSPKRPLESGLTPREKNRAKRKSIGDKESPRYKKLQAAQDTQKGTKVPANKRHKFGDDLGQERRLTGDHKHYMPDKKRMKHYTTSLKEPKESYDIYDIILSHLVAEGYADTNKAALAIMANMSEEWKQDIVEAAKDQSNKQIEKGVKTTYKAGNVLDNQHQGRSRGLSRLPAGEREAKTKRMRGRLKARRDDLFGERNKREDEARAEMKKKYGL